VGSRAAAIVLLGLVVLLLAVGAFAVVLLVAVPGLRDVALVLIGAVVAAILTSGVGLSGVWVNLIHETAKARHDRLLQAFGKLLLACDRSRALVDELRRFPNGRPNPFLPETISNASPRPMIVEERSWDPYHVANAAAAEMDRLGAEAEATIILEEGESSAVLAAWRTVCARTREFQSIVFDEDRWDTLIEHHERVLEALGTLREVAYRDLKRLAR
jgi:hypothetical protein